MVKRIKNNTLTMKKQYIAPCFEAIEIKPAQIMAASVSISGETDAEARSKQFWGSSIFDEKEEEEDNDNNSWY